MEFKWNEIKTHGGSFWDSTKGEIIPYTQEDKSDKNMINNPAGFEHRVALEALCRVVSELVEIEEKRNESQK